MEGDNKRKMQLKCALILNRFLEENKSQSLLNNKFGNQDINLVDNLSKLSSATGLRAATISSIFNADSIPSITNTILILIKLDKTLSQFGKKYELIHDNEIEDFELQLSRKKMIEKNKKA